MIDINPATTITFGMLTIAMVCLWLPRITIFSKFTQWSWFAFLVIAIITGLICKILELQALLWIAIFGGNSWILTQPNLGITLKALLTASVLIFSIALLTHRLPGFNNPKIISDLILSSDALPYSKYLNFDSALIALFILGFGHSRLSSFSELRVMLKKMLPIVTLTLTVVMTMSLLFGYVHWQPKWTPLFFIWAWGNLFFTCTVEEAFFRGFIQKQMMGHFSKFRFGKAIAITVAACLFGLAHYAGGAKYILLAAIAGAGYGWVYLQTQRIEAAILTHFTLNSLHFLLFTYPALAP